MMLSQQRLRGEKSFRESKPVHPRESGRKLPRQTKYKTKSKERLPIMRSSRSTGRIHAQCPSQEGRLASTRPVVVELNKTSRSPPIGTDRTNKSGKTSRLQSVRSVQDSQRSLMRPPTGLLSTKRDDTSSRSIPNLFSYAGKRQYALEGGKEWVAMWKKKEKQNRMDEMNEKKTDCNRKNQYRHDLEKQVYEMNRVRKQRHLPRPPSKT